MDIFKKLKLSNNTITIIAVLIGVALLSIAFNARLNAAIEPTKVPIATRNIGAKEKISLGDYEFVDASSDFLKSVEKNGVVLKTVGEIQNQYVTTETSIPAGGLFYKEQVVDLSELPNTIYDNIPENHTLFTLNVDINSTYGNSIYPGDKIDLYIKYTNDVKIIVYGKFVESIEVLAVRDSAQNDVFETMESGVPAKLLFAVENDIYQLLSQASFISGLSIVPVPRNNAYTENDNSLVVKSGQIQTYIETKTSQPSH